MEKTDSQPKQAALDNKSAFAGNTTAGPNTGIDQLGTDAGLDIAPEEPLATKEKLEARDDNRFEAPPEAPVAR